MSTRTRLHGLARCALALATYGSLFGCSPSPGGPEYTELGMRAEDASRVVLGGACIPLPVLPGGTIERDVTLAPGLSAHVLAVRDSVDVTLRGVEDQAAAHRALSQTTLYDTFVENLPVTTDTGAHYTVWFTAPCNALDEPQNN
jgi:hypothetical protein